MSSRDEHLRRFPRHEKGPALTQRTQQHAGKISNRLRRTKQPRVAGRPPERPAVLVVHLAHEQPPAPRIELRRCSPGPRARRRIEQQRCLREAAKQLAALYFESGPAHIFENEPEEDESQIAVYRLSIW